MKQSKLEVCNNCDIETKPLTDIQFLESVAECVICEELVSIVHQMLKNPNVDHDIEHLMKKACSALPNKSEKQVRPQ